MLTLWQRIDRKKLLHDLDGRAVLVVRHEDGTGVLMKFRHNAAKAWRATAVTTVDTRRPWLVRTRLHKPTHPIQKVLPHPIGVDIVAMPQWDIAPWAKWLRFMAAAFLSVGASALALFLGAPAYTPIIVTAVLVPLLMIVLPNVGPVRVRSLDQLPLDASNVVDYASRRLAGVHPETLEEVPHRQNVLGRIADIRAEYGALQLDVLHRIEHPALFDGSAPSTARFLAALVRTDDATPDTPIGTLEQLAAQLEITFATAKQHAATAGITHLPEDKRDDARRAAKAAHLARETVSDGERRAARTQLNRILKDLGLHYMPASDQPEALEPPR